MELTPVQYTTQQEDCTVLQSFGCVFHPDNVADFCVFINNTYQNFNVSRWYNAVHQLLDKTSSLDKTRLITFKRPARQDLSCWFGNYDYVDEDDELGFLRKFSKTKDGIIVEHSFLKIPAKFQGQGIAKEIMRESLREYVNMDLRTIYLYAALDGGGYAWAKYGFVVTNKADVDIILDKAMNSNSLSVGEKAIVKRIYDNYYNKSIKTHEFPIVKWAELKRVEKGVEIPYMREILRGSRWNGKLDLKNAKYFSIFKAYAFEN
jgi:predicted GNAT family acetyltransferase